MIRDRMCQVGKGWNRGSANTDSSLGLAVRINLLSSCLGQLFTGTLNEVFKKVVKKYSAVIKFVNFLLVLFLSYLLSMFYYLFQLHHFFGIIISEMSIKVQHF